MPDTTIPELVARLRELLSKAHPLPWLYRGKSDSLHVAPPEPPCSYGAGFLRLTEYDEDETRDEDIDLILEAVNALPTLLDALERGTDALARAWEEGAEAAFDAEYSGPLFGPALDEFYASNPYRLAHVATSADPEVVRMAEFEVSRGPVTDDVS